MKYGMVQKIYRYYKLCLDNYVETVVANVVFKIYLLFIFEKKYQKYLKKIVCSWVLGISKRSLWGVFIGDFIGNLWLYALQFFVIVHSLFIFTGNFKIKQKKLKKCALYFTQNALPTLSTNIHSGSCKKSHDFSYYLPDIVLSQCVSQCSEYHRHAMQT